jgi:hypothetical protein
MRKRKTRRAGDLGVPNRSKRSPTSSRRRNEAQNGRASDPTNSEKNIRLRKQWADLDEITIKILPHLKVRTEKAKKIGGNFLASEETIRQAVVLAGLARYLLKTIKVTTKDRMRVSVSLGVYSRYLQKQSRQRRITRRNPLFFGVH